MTRDMLTPRPLLCRIPLLPGESLWSYLTRLAAANSYDSPSILAWLCNKRLARLDLRKHDLIYPNHAEIFDVLTALGCLTPRELANSSVHYFARAPIWAEMSAPSLVLSDGLHLQLLDSRIRSKYLLRDHCVRFCPDCLREAAYHRLDWTPKEVLACLKHRRLLLDCCPDCAAWVNVRDVVRCQCSGCSTDLTNSAPDYVLGPFDVFAQKTIRSWWGLDVPEATGTDWILPDQPGPILHQLLEMVQDSIRSGTSTVWTVSGRYNLQLQAFKALADWPSGFCDFLRGRLEHQVQIQSYYAWCDFSGPVHLRSDSPFAFWLYGLLDWPRFGFVQGAVERFLVENNIRVEPAYGRSHFIIEADEELQRIARPLAEKGLERISKMMDSMGEA